MRRPLQPLLDDLLARQDGSTALARPWRVYFDTAQYQDLATIPDGAFRATFDDGLDRGRIVPALSFIHCIEIAKKPTAERQGIACVLAPLVDERRVIWVRSWNDLLRLEEVHCLPRGARGPLEACRVFASGFPEVCPSASADSTMPFGSRLERITSGLPVAYLPASTDFAAAMQFSRDRRRRRGANKKRYSAAERTARAVSIWLNDPEALQSPIDRIDWGRLPATRIFLAYEEGNDLGDAQSTVTDTEDQLHLPSAVYCDIAFVDARTHERLRTAGFLPDHVRRNSECLNFLELVLGSTGS